VTATSAKDWGVAMADKAICMITIELHSPAFSDHALLPPRSAKDNQDSSPPLEWSGVPDEAVELVITCEDPDAPSGTWIHWLVAGIDPQTTNVEEGKLPPGGIEGKNSYGDLGYGGPQPPIGDGAHRYFFRVHALNRASRLTDGFERSQLQAVFDDCEVARGTIVGTYQR
jgi:Raf kinase inhibitor-like YbhB/YbcL family protein